MIPSSLKIAVVGAGLIGKKHIELAAEGGCLHAIVDPDPAAQSLAAGHGVEWFDDLADCIATKRPDGVIVASPNGLHLEHGAACLAVGIPALIEKPLAASVADATALVDLVRQTGTPILVGHHRRHSPIIAAAKDIIDQGALGQLTIINGMFWLNKPSDYFDMDWRTMPGGGPVYINLIHDIDLLQYLCGRIVSVQAVEASHVRGFAVEDTAAILLTFKNGVLGAFTVSDAVSAPWSWELTSGENPVYPKTEEACYTIGGTKASLSIPDLKLWSHDGKQSWWSPISANTLEVMPIDPVAAQFRHFCDVIQNGMAPRVSAKDGLLNIRVLEAIKTAVETGAAVHLDDAG